MNFFSPLFIMLLIAPSLMAAEEEPFASDSSAIIHALTNPPAEKKKRRTRSAVMRGFKRVETESGNTMIKDLPPIENSVNIKIEFDVNAHTLRANSINLIDELGHALTDSSLNSSHFIVGGHTDSDGDDKYNLKLSLKRAITVKAYLIEHFGINPEILKVVGYGETSPIKSNTDHTGKQKNRRVEILKLSKKNVDEHQKTE